MSFEDERSLLLRWRDLVLEADPDIIIGYNIVNFDLPYLLNRAETLKVPQFWTWGRMRNRCGGGGGGWVGRVCGWVSGAGLSVGPCARCAMHAHTPSIICLCRSTSHTDFPLPSTRPPARRCAGSAK